MYSFCPFVHPFQPKFFAARIQGPVVRPSDQERLAFPETSLQELCAVNFWTTKRKNSSVVGRKKYHELYSCVVVKLETKKTYSIHFVMWNCVFEEYRYQFLKVVSWLSYFVVWDFSVLWRSRFCSSLFQLSRFCFWWHKKTVCPTATGWRDTCRS